MLVDAERVTQDCLQQGGRGWSGAELSQSLLGQSSLHQGGDVVPLVPEGGESVRYLQPVHVLAQSV